MLTFVEDDVTEVDLTPASVVFCYLHSAASAALKHKLENELSRGARIVMQSFPVMRWKPDRAINNNGRVFTCMSCRLKRLTITGRWSALRLVVSAIFNSHR
jgi:hypothetical protein